MHVSLQPKEIVEVERTPLVRFYRAVVLADAAKNRILPDFYVILEKYGNFPVEKDGKAEGV